MGRVRSERGADISNELFMVFFHFSSEPSLQPISLTEVKVVQESFADVGL